MLTLWGVFETKWRVFFEDKNIWKRRQFISGIKVFPVHISRVVLSGFEEH
jgi:hypothetical protein